MADTEAQLVLTDIGPIPESEAERLEPLIIDHTVSQRVVAEEPNVAEAAKRAAAMLQDEDEQEGAPRKPDAKAAAKAKAKEPAKPAAAAAGAEKKPEEKKKAGGKDDKKDDNKAEKKPAKGKKD